MADGTNHTAERAALAREAEEAIASTSPWLVYNPRHEQCGSYPHDKRDDAARAMRKQGAGAYLAQDGHVRQHHPASTNAQRAAADRRERDGVLKAEWERFAAELPNTEAYEIAPKPTLAELVPDDDEEPIARPALEPAAPVVDEEPAPNPDRVNCARPGCKSARAPFSAKTKARPELEPFCAKDRMRAALAFAQHKKWPAWVTGEEAEPIAHGPRPDCARAGCDGTAGPALSTRYPELRPFCMADRKRATVSKAKYKKWPTWVTPTQDTTLAVAAPVGECRHCKAALPPSRPGHAAREGAEAWCRKCRNRVSGSLYSSNKLPQWAIDEGFPPPSAKQKPAAPIAAEAPAPVAPPSAVEQRAGQLLDTLVTREDLANLAADFARHHAALLDAVQSIATATVDMRLELGRLREQRVDLQPLDANVHALSVLVSALRDELRAPAPVATTPTTDDPCELLARELADAARLAALRVVDEKLAGLDDAGKRDAAALMLLAFRRERTTGDLAAALKGKRS